MNTVTYGKCWKGFRVGRVWLWNILQKQLVAVFVKSDFKTSFRGLIPWALPGASRSKAQEGASNISSVVCECSLRIWG